MVAAFIFLLHGFFIIYVFVTYKKESIGEGLLAVAFIGIVFAVGWTIATMLTNLLFSPEWFIKWYWQPLDSWVIRTIRKEISRDTISLLILTSGEIAFYYFFFSLEKKKSSTKNDLSSGPPTSI
jgi:hypothetical protein